VTASASGPRLAALYFDGRSARARPVQLRLQDGTLHVDGEGIALQLPVRQVQWPERQRYGERQAHLPDDGLLSTPDGAAWDAWVVASRITSDSLTVRWMQSWRATLGALVLTIAALAAGYVWGLPAAAQQVAALLPDRLHQQVGDAAMESFREDWLLASKLPASRQAALRAQFEQAVRRTPAFATDGPAWTLHFHGTPKGGMGPNAFALPGGHIVVTDELVELLKDRPDVLIGVLGHELGHVQHQHGMRSVVQVGVLSAVAALVFGDISTLLSTAPVLLGHAAYSRNFEHEADRAAARLMRANGWDPAGFDVLFERLRDERARRGKDRGQGREIKDGKDRKTGDERGNRDEGFDLPIGLSTHPPDAERVRRMREEAAR
jgi:Zn-dependent protease with chaperone function